MKTKLKILKKFVGIKFRGSQKNLQFPSYLYLRSTLLMSAKVCTHKVITRDAFAAAKTRKEGSQNVFIE